MAQYESFLEPKIVKIGGQDFTISKIPCIKAQEIYAKIMKETDGYGNLGFTLLSPKTGIELTSYAAVTTENGSHVVLDGEAEVDRFVGSVNTLIQLHLAIIKENYGFLFDGVLRKLLESLEESADAESAE